MPGVGGVRARARRTGPPQSSDHRFFRGLLRCGACAFCVIMAGYIAVVAHVTGTASLQWLGLVSGPGERVNQPSPAELARASMSPDERDAALKEQWETVQRLRGIDPAQPRAGGGGFVESPGNPHPDRVAQQGGADHWNVGGVKDPRAEGKTKRIGDPTAIVEPVKLPRPNYHSSFSSDEARDRTLRALEIAPKGNFVTDDFFDEFGRFQVKDGWLVMADEPPQSQFVPPDPSRVTPQVNADGEEVVAAAGSTHRLCVIVPFRDDNSTAFTQSAGRWANLNEFLPYMHEWLTNARGEDGFRILVSEQRPGNGVFNKGIMMDIGYLLGFDECDYFVFHDVDHVPTNKLNTYHYPEGGPKHMCRDTDQEGFVPYTMMVGGALMMTRRQFWGVCGYASNLWGWGVEDDDMYHRIQNRLVKLQGDHLERMDDRIGTYHAMPHQQIDSKGDTEQFDLNQRRVRAARYGSPFDAKRNGLYTLPDWKIIDVRHNEVTRRKHPNYLHFVMEIAPDMVATGLDRHTGK